MDEIRKAKRRGDVRTVRKLREGTVTAIVDQPDNGFLPTEPLPDDMVEIMQGKSPEHPEHQE